MWKYFSKRLEVSKAKVHIIHVVLNYMHSIHIRAISIENLEVLQLRIGWIVRDIGPM